MRIERADGSEFDDEQPRDSRGRFKKKDELPKVKVPMTAEAEYTLRELEESFKGFDKEFKRMFSE